VQITRIALVALLAAAVAAPAASASVPIDRGTASSTQTMPAHHEAIATRNWEQIKEAPTVSLSPAPSNGLDALPTAAAIGGLSMVLLTLALLVRSAWTPTVDPIRVLSTCASKRSDDRE